MIHQPWGGIQARPPTSRSRPGVLTLRHQLNEILGQPLWQDPKQVEADTKDDRFMSAREALEYGLVDKLISRHERGREVFRHPPVKGPRAA